MGRDEPGPGRDWLRAGPGRALSRLPSNRNLPARAINFCNIPSYIVTATSYSFENTFIWFFL